MAELFRSSITIALLATCFSGWAGDFSFHSAGLRAGMSTSGRPHEFLQTEAFVNWNLPWQWNLGADWHLVPRFSATAGWLHQHHHDAFVGSLGPSLALGWKDFPVTLAGGASPTVLSKTEFYTKDFGSYVQFTDYIGLDFEPGEHWLIGYRYQHMSNCGLSHHNPGLNLHTIQLGYRF